MDPRVRDALVAVSATNLLLFPRWAGLLTAPERYVLAVPVPAAAYLGVLWLMVLIAFPAWVLAWVSRRYDLVWLRALLGVGLVASLLVGVHWILHAVRITLGHADAWTAPGWPYVAVLVLVVTSLLGARRGRRLDRPVLRVALVCALLLFPLAPVLAAQGAWQVVDGPVRLRDAQGQPAPWLPVDPTLPRVVVLVFDELDAELAFDARPPGVALPELDRLLGEAVVAETVYSAHSETMRSLPAMTTGRFVDEAQASTWAQLHLRFQDGSEASWADTDNVFRDARDAGQNVGIVGYFHPYCRVFSGLASTCTNRGFELPGAGVGHWGRSHLADQLEDLLPGRVVEPVLVDPLVRDGALESFQSIGISAYRGIESAAIDAVSEPRLGLTFVHLNVPHPVGLVDATRGFYDAIGDKLVTGAGPGYWDNLVLADRTLGRLRGAMEEAGLWNDTHLILTSDHGYRIDFWSPPAGVEGPEHDLLTVPTEHEVPFLYKPAGDAAPMSLDTPFNNVHLRAVVATIRDGAVVDGPTLDRWLDAQTLPAPGHYHVH